MENSQLQFLCQHRCYQHETCGDCLLYCSVAVYKFVEDEPLGGVIMKLDVFWPITQ